MSSSSFEIGYAHHVWATVRLIDACLDLNAEQLATSVPGTRGPILDTLRHIVEGDTSDLSILTDDQAYFVDGEGMSLADARALMERDGAVWAELLAGPLDPDAVVREVDDTDGYRRWAPAGFRLAQGLHHGIDHRSQICTALTTIGVQPPRIDVFDHGLEIGRVREQWPNA